jgi:O-antigen/teichoic acid export membrane protein
MAERPTDELFQAAASMSRSSVFLLVGQLLSYPIGFVGVTVTARLLAGAYGSSEPYGWLFVASSLAAMISILGDLGVGMGISNRIVVLLKKRSRTEAATYFWTGMAYSFGLTLVYAILVLIFGIFIVSSVLKKPDASFLVPLAAIGLLASYLYNAGYSGCVVVDKVWMSGLTVIIQVATQTILSPTMIILGYGVWGVTLIYLVVAPLLSAIPSLIIVIRSVGLASPTLRALRDAVSFGIPLGGSAIIGSLQSSVYNILLSRFALSAELGNYSVALRLKPLIYVWLYPINTMVFPTFSRLDERDNIARGFDALIRFNALIVFPISLMILFLSKQFVVGLFGSLYAGAWIYLSLLSMYWFSDGLGCGVASDLLSATGRTLAYFRITLVANLTALALGFLLIPWFGVVGAILVNLFVAWPFTILIVRYTGAVCGVTYPVREVAKIFVVSLFSALTALAVGLGLSSINNGIAAVLTTYVLGIAVDVFLVKRFGLIRDAELTLLEDSLFPLPIVGSLFKTLMYVYRRI